MKKDVKLYNMILPPFMLFFFAPTLWIVSSLPAEKELLSSDGSSSFSGSVQEVIKLRV